MIALLKYGTGCHLSGWEELPTRWEPLAATTRWDLMAAAPSCFGRCWQD
jgi:hypothetical protein